MLEVIESLELEVGDGELAFSVQAMRELCQCAGWEVPERFSLRAATSPAVLMHWRAMSVLIGLLGESQRCLSLTSGGRQSGSLTGSPASSLSGGSPPAKAMKGSGLPSGQVSIVSQEGSAAAKGVGGAGKVRGVSRPVGEVSADIPSRRVIVGRGQTTFTPLGGGRGSPTARTASPGVGWGRAVTVELPSMGSPGGLQEASPDLPEAFDSHLHWDRVAPKFGTGRADFGRFLRIGLSRQPQILVELVGGVVVYCDPKTWPAISVRVDGSSRATP